MIVFGFKSLKVVFGVLINFYGKLVFHFRIIVKYFEEQEVSKEEGKQIPGY